LLILLADNTTCHHVFIVLDVNPHWKPLACENMVLRKLQRAEEEEKAQMHIAWRQAITHCPNAQLNLI
jgi:hypothetical protein